MGQVCSDLIGLSRKTNNNKNNNDLVIWDYAGNQGSLVTRGSEHRDAADLIHSPEEY